MKFAMKPDCQKSAPANLPKTQMDPRDRLRRFGPIRPMEHAPSLIERILFS